MAPKPDLLIDRTLNGLRERVWLHHGYHAPSVGIASDRLYYCVGTPERAYSFTTYTGKYPDSVTWVPAMNQRPTGVDVSVHIRAEDASNYACECVEGGRCRGDGSALMAHELYEQWQMGDIFLRVSHEVVLAHLRSMHDEGTWTHSSP
jgi:hypothetical protein